MIGVQARVSPDARMVLAGLLCGLLPLWMSQPIAHAKPAAAGVPIAFQLPMTGPLPRTYRVTLAIVDRKNPNWIISQFVCGKPEKVTVANGGKFTARWNGLDDNFMPMPPGTYGVKGIYMPASRWRVDGRYHSITPKFLAGASAWLPSPEDWKVPSPLRGDPVESPLGAIACTSKGMAVIQYAYLENGLNDLLVDLNKPCGYSQVISSFNSGCAAGGTAVTTDGRYVWSFNFTCSSTHLQVVRFGGPHGGGASRQWRFNPQGWVVAMACKKVMATGHTMVYVAERSKIVRPGRQVVKSKRRFTGDVVVLDGRSAKVLQTIAVDQPDGMAIHGGWLYVVHARSAGGFAVIKIKLRAGLEHGSWRLDFDLPLGMRPGSVAVDSHGRIYVSDAQANHVYQFAPNGKQLHTFGRLAEQKPGSYDPQTFMAPGDIATWRTAQGHDRLLVMDRDGSNSMSEWGADGGFIQEYLGLQTMANGGYAMDPQHPDEFYICGQGNWLERLRLHASTNSFLVDAVWPLPFMNGGWKNIGNVRTQVHLESPKLIRAHGHTYLASGLQYVIYRKQGHAWMLSAAILRRMVGGKPS